MTLAAPVSALAARYVNDTGSDELSPGTPSTCIDQAQPCQHIQYAVSAAGDGETIFVDSGHYAESVSLGGDKSLRQSGSGSSVIDGGTEPAIQTFSGDPPRAVSGFVLRSSGITAKLQGAVTLSGNLFDSPGATGPHVQLLAGAGGSVVAANLFVDSVTSDYQIGVQVSGVSAATTISDNSFLGFGTAILVQRSRPRVSGNTIAGAHATGGFPGVGILVINDAVPDVVSNLIRDPGAGQAIGIWVGEDPTTVQDTGAAIEQTRIFGHDPGILVDDATGGVYLFSDLIAKSPGAGLILRDNAPTATGEADVRARNVTIWGGTNPPDIYVQEADLQLDSSIVGAGGINRPTAGGHCSITHSRGPFRGNDVCNDFTTVANPSFKNPALDDFHLAQGSPLIDAGNPTSPAVGAKDMDDRSRAIDGDRDCEVRRDIGADEFEPTLAGCVLPYQTRAEGGSGRDFKLRVFGERGGNYTLCVRGPRRIENRLVLCHGFSLRQVGPDLYESIVQWGRDFRFMGEGTYTASWYRPGTSRLLGPRKTFSTGVCPPQSQLQDGVWKPSPRHRVIIPCYTVTGVVTAHSGLSRNDGDYLFGFNTTRGRNFSHAELMPRDIGYLRRGASGDPANPRRGERLEMTGVFICDGFHGPFGHHELHPVFRIKYLDRGGRVATSGPQYGGTPNVGLRFPGWHPCP